MSDVTKVQSRHAVYAGLTVDIAEESLGRVSKLLSGINGGLYKAVGSALTRSAAAGEAEAFRARSALGKRAGNTSPTEKT